ncbi:unnamed protein product [Moneuplotes crassus]|uniref:BZIP domain-containing protein n=1 Tax=Euplotes crassus TaxID=5936 RepID=A0AAD2D1I0_EUPCR|nr:unnamed protein product [Moneuplotes crassus]
MNKKRVIKERAKKDKTLSVKERSKIHRQRKKKYYEDLERRVEELEEENKKLKASIQAISKMSPTNDLLTKLQQEEDFMYCVLPKIVTQNPDQFRMSMYETCRDAEGPYGSLRIQVIKDSFRKIIDNLMPLNFKVLLAAFSHVETKKLFDMARDKIRNDRILSKYYRAHTRNQDTVNKCEERTEKRCRNRYFIESSFYKYPFSEAVISCWSKVTNRTKKFCFTMRKLVKNLLKIRNQMLNEMKDIHNCFFEAKMYESYSKQDLINFSALCNEFKGTEIIEPSYLYELENKSSDDEKYQDAEISPTES